MLAGMIRRATAPVLLATVVVVASQCGPTGMPMLSVSGPTSAFRDGTRITLRPIATLADGKVGRGQVVVTTDVGVVMEEGLTLDEFGTASFTFSCNVATNPDCIVDTANIKLRWQTTPPVTLDYPVRLTNRPTVPDGGTGGGGGGMCIADRYSHMACAGAGKPDVNVTCCLNMLATQIPNCNDLYACDGMRFTRMYTPFTGDAGAAPVELEFEFRIPTYRFPTYAECMTQQVGFVVRRAGVELRPIVPTTYGYIDLNGDYFAFRQTDTGTLRPHEDRECLSVADGGVLGVWHSIEGAFTVPPAAAGQRRTDYVPQAPLRFFFQSLLKR